MVGIYIDTMLIRFAPCVADIVTVVDAPGASNPPELATATTLLLVSNKVVSGATSPPSASAANSSLAGLPTAKTNTISVAGNQDRGKALSAGAHHDKATSHELIRGSRTKSWVRSLIYDAKLVPLITVHTLVIHPSPNPKNDRPELQPNWIDARRSVIALTSVPVGKRHSTKHR